MSVDPVVPKACLAPKHPTLGNLYPCLKKVTHPCKCQLLTLSTQTLSLLFLPPWICLFRTVLILPQAPEWNHCLRLRRRAQRRKRTSWSRNGRSEPCSHRPSCVCSMRFQRQKYLSLQQTQELSNILNLSYKQVKTWFQNQRMKCKKWQKNNWPRNSTGMPQGTATAEFLPPGVFWWTLLETCPCGVTRPGITPRVPTRVGTVSLEATTAGTVRPGAPKPE